MLVPYNTLKAQLQRVLLKHRFSESRAELCAGIFADNSRDGVHSHGLNRFPTFIQYVREGLIATNAEPETVSRNGAIEKWNGNLAPGMYVATLATTRASEIAKENGLGCVAVKNTNHWMRGGTYAWQAADKGCISICSTNAIANMPPWGGKRPTLGNNPLVIGVPRKEGHIVLDMAMSQYSYGKLNEYKMKEEELPVAGGYDSAGELSKNPVDILKSERTLPVGFWKGSGLSLMMDLLVATLSDGQSVKQITEQGKEYGVSQFFLCISADSIDERLIEEIIQYTKSSEPVDKGSSIKYPGEQTIQRRSKSETEGVEVNEAIWQEVSGL
jgi:3-dehydro-L-gulonate 2-dehydrogenase